MKAPKIIYSVTENDLLKRFEFIAMVSGQKNRAWYREYGSPITAYVNLYKMTNNVNGEQYYIDKKIAIQQAIKVLESSIKSKQTYIDEYKAELKEEQ